MDSTPPSSLSIFRVTHFQKSLANGLFSLYSDNPMTFQEVSTQINFPKAECDILAFWEREQIFQKSVDQRPHERLFSFYDGPPFATGLPHYGHLLPGIIKDIIPRYYTMKGYRVERRWGWDCHGLPIENIIEEELNLKSKADVEAFGIGTFNEACRSTVLKYAEEWKKTVRRIGRWVDMEKSYQTMDISFMESVWWVFSELWKKGLIVEGKKPMHICPRCVTPLSNFEVTQGYCEIKDQSVIAKFQLTSTPAKWGRSEKISLLAWTTTPWTLPGNVLLAVNPAIEYCLFSIDTHDELFVSAKERINDITKGMNPSMISELKGLELLGLEYTPLFPYFSDNANSFRVVGGDFVTTEDGTGIVHIAPAFGEDDYQVGLREKTGFVQHVSMDGRFTASVTDFSGMEVKAKEDPTKGDIEIVKWLAKHNKVFSKAKITHSYPHCWRCDSPLLNYATSSWFVKVTDLKEDLLKNNQQTRWIPDHIRDGRFGKWLENARDWAISRNRFWGCPLPIWKSEDNDSICIGSVDELETLSKQKITDLHKHMIDPVTITQNGKTYRRIPEVLDCWFESGSMPYAQMHYPFEHKAKFESGFPADFIAEGQDQTRGWFYTLHVLATALTRGPKPSIPVKKMEPAFKNVIVNGIILAEDGKKMSKKLRNYPPPETILDQHGADALRLYLIQSPAVRAEELRLSESGIQEIIRKILLKWWNAYAFFANYAAIDQWKPSSTLPPQSDNILDQWILSKLQSLLIHAEKEMAAYRLYAVVPKLIEFIEELTNGYIRLNRKRFWGEGQSQDKEGAYHTLYHVLFTFAKTMAPFTPFIAEMTYQNLKSVHRDPKPSVHLEDYPVAKTELIKSELEESVTRMQEIMVLGRNLREKANIKVKIPLKRLTIIHRNPDVLNLLKKLENYIYEELNLYQIEYESDEEKFVELRAKPNSALLGPKLGSQFGQMAKEISQLSGNQLRDIENGKSLSLLGHLIGREDIKIEHHPRKGHESLASDSHITIELDLSLDEQQLSEGLAREVVNRIQKLRKTSNLKLDDRITIQFSAEGKLAKAIEQHSDYIQEQTLALSVKATQEASGEFTERCEIEKESLSLAITRV